MKLKSDRNRETKERRKKYRYRRGIGDFRAWSGPQDGVVSEARQVFGIKLGGVGRSVVRTGLKERLELREEEKTARAKRKEKRKKRRVEKGKREREKDKRRIGKLRPGNRKEKKEYQRLNVGGNRPSNPPNEDGLLPLHVVERTALIHCPPYHYYSVDIYMDSILLCNCCWPAQPCIPGIGWCWEPSLRAVLLVFGASLHGMAGCWGALYCYLVRTMGH